MRENAKIKFINLREGYEIIDFYFETNESINNLFIMEDLASFLSFKQ
jgi:hypothetical protein